MATQRATAGGDERTSRIIETTVSSAHSQRPMGPAVPAHVIIKLLGFTAAMVVAPIGTYFATLHSIFNGNSTWAGASAAVMANVILIAYVVVAFREDEGDGAQTAVKKTI